ncbi:hypothetical protein A6E01_20705 (plasmid) [Vibrio breoganii]|uniref:Single-stranded DNA-binding protein n=1 Tax=Vibrio breoganii TaxID=553239 RepID=A0AAN0Y0E3_9VIBR|nr:single-stranded DNA-binding protein [Vibrio breoganii]ANO35634.1 hypothetical protein A6E01_20705 [Vibrio breoganii]PML19300.1 hypothetical protein BCT84_18675 [Vibrio breoganii]
MSDLNEVTLIGSLGADPAINHGQNGAIATLSVATSKSWKEASGEKREKTEWHRVVCFGKLAEIVGQYYKKGALIYVRGELQTRKWTDNEGKDRYSTEVVVSNYTGALKILNGRDRVSAGNQPAAPAQSPQQVPTTQAQQPAMSAQVPQTPQPAMAAQVPQAPPQMNPLDPLNPLDANPPPF